jgi:transposase
MTDDFLRDVERLHSWHIEYGHRDAAQRTAKAVGVSVRTVHSWLYRGRERGVIAAAYRRARR